MINWLYAVMTIFAQRFNIFSSKFDRSTALIAPPGYAPGNSDWWPYGFVLSLYLQVQTVDSSRGPRKDNLVMFSEVCNQQQQCVGYWLDQGLQTTARE